MVQLVSLLCELNGNQQLAGTIAICILAGVVVFCAAFLIIKKLVLNKKYHMDEKFVKEYRQKMIEREQKVEEIEKKKDSIGEEF